jgi:hypothetical protein
MPVACGGDDNPIDDAATEAEEAGKDVRTEAEDALGE